MKLVKINSFDYVNPNHVKSVFIDKVQYYAIKVLVAPGCFYTHAVVETKEEAVQCLEALVAKIEESL